MVPKSAPYKCPWQGCEMVKKDRFSISLHYGITHKVTLKLMHDMPEDALKEPIEVVCKLCQQSFTAHRYLYTHLSDTHFQPEIGKKLGILFGKNQPCVKNHILAHSISKSRSQL